MKKILKIIGIVIACLILLGVIVGAVTYGMLSSAANADEYTIGKDTIKSVKAVAEQRDVTSVSTKTGDGVKTKSIHYQSESVQHDLSIYVQYLREEAGFNLIQDMNLNEIPSRVQLGKQSEEPGHILIMTIDYDVFGYTITIQKGKGSLTVYG